MRKGEVRDARQAERREAMAPSTMRANGLLATDVTVVDLSQTGIRIASDARLAIGEEISIGLSGVGSRRAYVAWCRDGQYGCAFEQPLKPGEESEAFTSASVVRLGTPTQVSRASQAGANAELMHLYGSHRLWRLPFDALAVGAIYVALFGWLVWYLVR